MRERYFAGAKTSCYHNKKVKACIAACILAAAATGCGSYGIYSGEAMQNTAAEQENTAPADETSDLVTGDAAADETPIAAAQEAGTANTDTAKDDGSANTDTAEQGEIANTDTEAVEEYLPGYADESDFKNRHTGSASYITDKTLIVSIFVDEEEDVWTEGEKEKMLEVCGIAYNFLDEYLKENYDADTELIFDWQENPDLLYTTRIYESIPAYVTSEEEAHMDDLEDEWVNLVPVQELCLKYETESIAFLYFVPHEGCSYSSMHFVEDPADTWNEGCLLYLQDMYSPDLDYETPTVFAHELLHLFGAEDYYSSAEVFSDETYSALAAECADDIMLHTFDTVNGVYTTYPDEVHGEITPVTAYLLGIYDESAVSTIPELIRGEKAVFPGSTHDRPF